MRKLLLIGGLTLWFSTSIQAQQVKDPVPKQKTPKERRSTTPEPPLAAPTPEETIPVKFNRPWRHKSGVNDTAGRGILIRALTDVTFHPELPAFVAAHRGEQDGGTEPENSIEAIRELINPMVMVDIVELDLKRSKDDSVFVMHDNYLQRTTDFLDKFPGVGTGRDAYGRCREYTWTQLKTLTLKQADFTYTNRTIPLFREVLRYVRDSTPILINLDIRDTALFRATWNMVREENAFDICIFKTEKFTPRFFMTNYYTPLHPTERAKVMFFPMITPNPPEGLSPEEYYVLYESTGAIKGYELSYRRELNVGQEAQLLNLVDNIHDKNRVRVHVFNILPGTYQGKYMGHNNIDQCCNDDYDSRGDWEYLFHPRPGTKGANGYVITDHPIMLAEYLGLAE